MRRIGLIGALTFALALCGGASAGPLIGAPVSSIAAESCHAISLVPANLFSVSGYAGQAEFIMVFNAASAPADGAVTPIVVAYAPAAGNWSISYGAAPAFYSAGITVCDSSTGPLTKTAISTNNTFSGLAQQ